MKRQPIILSLFLLLAGLVLSAQPGHAARFLLRGTLFFEDGNPECNTNVDPCPLLLSGSFFRAARTVLLTVENRHGVVFGRGATSSGGEIRIAVDAPVGEALILFAEVDNFALHLFHETDGANEPYRRQLRHFTWGTGDLDLSILWEGLHYHQARIFEPESTLLPDTNEYTTLVSFSGALNINEVILQARETAQAHRDPREHDTIRQVPVEYCDPTRNAQYLFSITLSCAQIDGRHNGPRQDGLDDGYVDSTIAHEYTHHLQATIGNWDMHFPDMAHSNCTEIDTLINNDPEFAWSEGFADLFAEHLIRFGDRNSLVRPTIDTNRDGIGEVEDGCLSPAPGGTDPLQRFISIEGNVVATLWDLIDGLGTGPDSWDRVDGGEGNGPGFHSIFQIFDRELDGPRLGDLDGGLVDDAPDLPEFYEAWIGRHGNDPATGQPAFDPILNRYQIVPGGERSSWEKMIPQPFYEAAPDLPELGYASVYTPSNFLMPLRVTRRLSFVEGVGTDDRFLLHVGVSNLGDLTMQVPRLPGSPSQGTTASFTTNIRFLRGSGWLALSPASATVARDRLTPVTFQFLPGTDVTPEDRYSALVDFVFRITLTNNQILTATRTVEINFDFVDSATSDRDHDGLRNGEERDLRSRPGFECLSLTDHDSDGDGLRDGDEFRIYGTSPCRADTDGDSFTDWEETREPCFLPLIPDNGASRTGNPDGDGLNNTEEGILGTDLCKADTDGDGRNDGPATDNCPRIASPFEFLDMNGDGEGNPCDNDADGDLCEKQYDANDLDPLSLCYAGRDRFSPRRFMRAAEEDLRIFHFLDVYLENLGALVPRDCGGIPCPPPIGQWTDPQFETISIVRGADFGLGAADGFGWTSELLSDLDGRGRRDYAISAPWADGGPGGIDSGAVLLISGEDGRELGRLRGTVAGGAFGSSLASLADGRLAIGAPGAPGKAGAVQLYRLDTRTLVRSYTAGKTNDRFGASVSDLGDIDGDGASDFAVGAPGWSNLGAVYTARSGGALSQIALGKTVGDRLGEKVVSVDADGDAKPEILAGSPGAMRAGLEGAGEVALLGRDGARRWARAGRHAGENLGAALAVSKDGKELLVGAPGSNCAAGTRCGRANLLRPDGSGIVFLAGTEAGARYGTQVAFGPDLDGDGLASLVLIEPGPWSAAGLGRSHFFER